MQISITGCGWLGQPLALRLKSCGCDIVASTRSKQKCQALASLGLHPVQYSLGDNIHSKALGVMFESDILILNIPVGRKNPTIENFAQHMQILLEQASHSKIKKVIFISTTSVYGNSSCVITEKSPTNPTTLSGKINLHVEKLVTKYFPNNSSIIRPAGLVGADRHPVNYLAGKTGVANPDDMVNLIHQEDVINTIERVIQKSLWGNIINLSSLIHPTRIQYYTWAAKKLGLPPPTFIAGSGIPSGKQINSDNSLQLLGLRFKYPNPFDMLGQYP
ncbi:NAD-dependent epimerase/dehydratase family protein [Paraglaciecola sp.]|uniref:NAD-dependent epimerase/dehydratase family protein n=1 Tax=Paraglaciecola sp. TaxID=1920173 RepID=UPI003267CC35